MPGVTNGHHRWNDSESQMSDFDSYPRRGVSPHRTDVDMKAGLKPSYSNGYSSDQQSDSNDDGPVYILEHLATFSVGPQYGLLSPKDGLRRLFQMEKTNGIWTQKMQLRLEKSWVVIIDYENGDVVERFPMNLICDPTSFTSNDPRDLYNNILVFIVQEDPKGKIQNNSEMHIFQCVRVSAQEIVDELKRFMNGKWKPSYRNSESYSIPPPPNNPPPEPPVNGGGIPGVSVKEQVNMFNAAAAAAAASSVDFPAEPPQRIIGGHQRLDRIERSEQIRPNYARESNDETSSTSSDKYEKDVAILNHCFDDIERFIARLQHAAAAFRELERRYKSRKNKKKDLGDGLLSMRAKPPPEREFIDILQKFKLSFNLLAKLKSHIHDPNAPELVHFLFTPLALIVDAARESGYGPNLAHKVVSPLLTRDAIELLSNCCTSKESDLWHSLGDPWFMPREQWKGYQGSYHPVFSDGWAPDYPFSEERERAELTASAAASVAQKQRREEIRRVHEEERDSRYGSEYYYGSDHGGDTDRPRSPDHPHHTQAFENRQYESRHIEMSRRDFVLERGGAGTPPLEHDYRDHHDRDVRSDFSADSMDRVSRPLDMQQQFERQQKQWFEQLKARGAKVVQVMYPRTANNEKELTVVRGEFLEVLDDTRKWWKARNARGQEAHVPHTIVTPFQGTCPVDDDIFNNPLYATRGGSYYSPSDSPGGHDRSMDSNLGRSSGSPRERDSRPPPIPPPVPASAEWVRRERQGKKDNLTNNTPHVQDSTFQRSPNLSISSNSSLRPSDRALIKEMANGMRPASPIRSVVSSESGTDVSEPPPPPPMPPENYSSVSSRKSQPVDSPQKVQRDQLHEELKLRVSLGPKSHKKWGNAQFSNLHCIYLTPETPPADVQVWLEVKGFSERTREMFKTFTGKMMFCLTRHQLETHLGHEEGTRLHSNLLVQRNLSGYKTMSSHELQSILEERRKKVDAENFSRSFQGEAGRDGKHSSIVDIGRI